MEGYGSTIERHASKLRGNQEQVNYANEAFIHINGSLLHNADYLVERALNLHFGNDKDDGKLKPWHFCNTTESLAKNAGVLKSVDQSVLKRLNTTTRSKVSFADSKRKKAADVGRGERGEQLVMTGWLDLFVFVTSVTSITGGPGGEAPRYVVFVIRDRLRVQAEGIPAFS